MEVSSSLTQELLDTISLRLEKQIWEDFSSLHSVGKKLPTETPESNTFRLYFGMTPLSEERLFTGVERQQSESRRKRWNHQSLGSIFSTGA
jgi:hypothetical protein